ncbi:MAG TPA: DUF4124 domain-containing protein [Steroidobacteraceae bacterium]
MKRVLLCALLMGWSAMASAVVYKWTDAQGKVQYGDNPPNGVHAEVVELLGTHAAAHTSNTASTDRPASTPSSPNASDIKKAVDSDVAQARDKQCADAQARYKTLIEGRRLYKTGENGERQYLTSEEIDSERLNAKRDIDESCNGAT